MDVSGEEVGPGLAVQELGLGQVLGGLAAARRAMGHTSGKEGAVMGPGTIRCLAHSALPMLDEAVRLVRLAAPCCLLSEQECAKKPK